MKALLNTANQTRHFGEWLSKKIKGGQVISLEGPLGAGKTTLVQGLIKGLGVKQKVTSPTFIMFRVHEVKKSKHTEQANLRWLVHADAYRVEDPKELIAAGLEDYLQNAQTAVVVEWGDKVKKIFPRKTLHIKMSRSLATRARSKKPARLPGRMVIYPASFGRFSLK